ncbi:MAG TPA: GDSL-type esterase/lipase family protein [Hyphomicrobiaceae bacterium]|nr:GDSL-type esterase/lipase family protein [Hyphomicrobiaceae bacterium]
MRSERSAAVWLIVTCLAVLLAAPPLRAQAPAEITSFTAPFPEAEVYRIQVYGDTLAEGLVGGLTEALEDEHRIQLQRRHRAIAGLLRGDGEDDARAIEFELGREPPHIAVVMLGVADRVPIRTSSGRRAVIGSEEWRAEYGRRLDRIMRVFRKKGITVYWVSLPIMRRQDVTDDVRVMGGVMRERALVNNVRFIDVLASFADEDGSYTAYGPDIAGKNRLLRQQDGIHFTPAGYRKLAHFVERELLRDIAQAKADRAIPLAGAEEEQKRIRPTQLAAFQPGKAGPGGRPGSSASPQRTEISREGDLRADNTRVTVKDSGRGKDETITLEILRPAIPASVVAVVTRRESSDKASQVGDPVMTEIGGGVTIVSSVTIPGEGPGGDRRRSSPTTSLDYRVLIKGERLPVRPGRSDDLPWPREEVLSPEALAKAAAASAPAPPPVVRGPPRGATKGRAADR